MRINADELAAFFLVGDNIVDGGFGGGPGSGGHGDDRHALVSGRRRSFQGYDVGKFRIVDDNADSFGGVLRRSAADGDHIVGSCRLECFHAGFDDADAGIGLDAVEHGIGEALGFKQVGYFFDDAEFDQIGVGND